ncbi:hypothetical protein G6F59_018226 [Rhizopus arrhizus]|nr:hypothetical protein G6F59_018226 [Rhizopus arrhizus]
MLVPGVLGGFVHAQRVLEVLQHAQVVQRVRVASNAQGQIAYPGAANGVGRQQRHLREALVQILDDRQRLGQRVPVMQQGGHQLLRIQRAIGVEVLLAALAHQAALDRQ